MDLMVGQYPHVSSCFIMFVDGAGTSYPLWLKKKTYKLMHQTLIFAALVRI